MSNYDECTRLWQTIHPADPDILFCCAGSSIPKLFQDLTKVDIELGIDINYKTVINVVHTGFKHALSNNTDNLEPHNFKREASYCSAQSSAFSLYRLLAICPMKSAIESLSIILRQELFHTTIVTCVFLNFQSEGFEEEQKTKPDITKKIEGPSNPIPGDECARLIIDQLDKGYDSITTDFIGWFWAVLF